ncbi:hypothetical protein [Eubacterium oxidoreducens]|uniref:Uncharacterized protein n=1 Tax=Eubacterium oxidoreducens TaxID=1732 RepID=A0A1G6AVF4_EUBOX|nr:hypothetical protein [Eubacterium oxidoreducens]SDB12386.1 hypothetical protein SAMN02910417_00937 [Eubacterium oxidoreducens]
MNIPFVKQATYLSQTTTMQNQLSNQPSSQSKESTKQLKDRLQELKRTPVQNEKAYVGTSVNKQNGYLDLTSTSTTKKNESYKKPTSYNYKEVATKILRAKTSISAGQAVIAAKRKISQIKRQIAAGDGDAEELQVALSHAKRMEIVAKKKKRHLELEELVEHTQKQDEKLQKQEDAAAEIKNCLLDEAKEEITKQEDAIFKERENMLAQAVQEYPEQMLDEMNEMIAEYGEEELKELEELSEIFDQMEIVDPHMSEEGLEKLKRKHRSSEQKDIVKADMEYLKDMIHIAQEKGSQSMGSAMGINIQA